MITVAEAASPAQFQDVRQLFEAYARELNVDLCFQNFAAELAALPGGYAPPEGCLLLALADGQAAGCVALRKVDPATCEMKRLYVAPAFRKHGAGRRLAEEVIARARRRGYQRMVLDTLERLAPALRLYESLGFQRGPAYYHNPLEGVVYLTLAL